MNKIFRFATATVAAVLFLAAIAPAQTTRPSADGGVGAGKVVALDYFYNHQIKNGKQFHYIWDDDAASGYSRFGDVWKQYGATLASLPHAPTLDDLRHFSVYLIVNPNNTVKAADHKPNYIQPADIDAIVAWVHDGGVLGLFANDEKVGGCEFVHLNQLSQRFGITFNNDVRNQVPSARDRSPGTFSAAQFPDHPLFKDIPMVYMKEICTLELASPAESILTVDKEKNAPGKDIIMAVSHYGKGLVFAVGDPWFYNEYIDVKAPGLPIENRKAAENLAQWLLAASAPPVTP